MPGRRQSTMGLIGQRFGSLTVIGLGAPAHVLVQCNCGSTPKEAQPSDLRRGKVRSCGCHRDRGLSRLRHGMTGTRVHNIWKGILERCDNPKKANYGNYGGRGITVCERWRTFENFYADMGDCPEGYSIERLKNDKGYEPGNCIWADRLTQANNKRSNVLIAARGEVLTISQWARKTGVSAVAIRNRLRDGLTGERAVALGYIRRREVG